MKKNKGFTLVELLAVIIVLAIIMVIAIPTVTTVMNNARKNALYEYALKVNTKALEVYLAENTELAGSNISTCGFYYIKDLMGGDTGNYVGMARVEVSNRGNSLDPTYDVRVSLRDTNYAVDNVLMSSSTLKQSDFLNEIEAHKGLTISLNDCNGTTQTITGSSSGGGSGKTTSSTTTTQNQIPPEPTSTITPTTSLLLSSLTIDGYDINFNKNVSTYTLQVENSVTSLNINAQAEAPNDVTVEINGNNNLDIGRNTISIIITNKNTNEKNTYTIIATRVEENIIPSTNPTTNPTTEPTSEITTSSDATTTNNDSSVPTTTSDDNTTTRNSSSGNKLSWTGTRRTTEKTTTWDPNSGNPSPAEQSSISTLSLISISGYSLQFSESEYEYDLESRAEEQLILNYRPTNSNAKVEVLGNENLSEGGVVTLKVTSANGFYTSEYNIYVTPAKIVPWYIKALPYVAVVLGAIVIILGLRVSSQRKASKERQRKRETEEEAGRLQMQTQMQNINAQVQNSQVQSQSKDNTN